MMLTIPGYRIVKVFPPGAGKLSSVLCQPWKDPSDGDYMRLFPGGKQVKIKSRRSSTEGVLLTLKGIRRADLFPGGVLIPPDWPVLEGREALFLPDGGGVPEVAEFVRGGIHPDFNKERIVGRASFRLKGSFIMVRFPSGFPLIPGAGYSILGADFRPRHFTLLWPGRPEPEQMRRLNALAPRRPEPCPPPVEIYGRILHIQGWVQVPPSLAGHNWEAASRLGLWVLRDEERGSLERKILKKVSCPGGADLDGLDIPDRPRELLLALAQDMKDRKKLLERDGWYTPPGPPRLSPFHRSWLVKVAEAGDEGIRIRSLKSPADRKVLEELGRMGLIRGGQALWLTSERYDALVEGLLKGRKPGDVILLSQARTVFGGSRPATLELLEILEADGRLASESGKEGRIVI